MITKAGSGLLVRLRSYRTRAERDSLEDFLTEAFCWLLENYSSTEEAIKKDISARLGVDIGIPSSVFNWETQVALGANRVDMVARSETELLIFEHKVWAALGDRQLERYRETAEEFYPNHKIYVILITATTSQHHVASDCCYCWSDIYRVLDGVAESSLDEAAANATSEFLDLLRHEGLGPTEAIQPAAVKFFPQTRHLSAQLEGVWSLIAHKDWSLPFDYKASIKRLRWGRTGIEFGLGESGDHWRPGLFVGCVLDGSDHCIEHRWTEVKLQLIFDFGQPILKHYTDMEAYKKLRTSLNRISESTRWSFYDHLEDSGKTNRYHPLYIEQSLFELLRGCHTAEEQGDVIYNEIDSLFKNITESDVLSNLILECASHYEN